MKITALPPALFRILSVCLLALTLLAGCGGSTGPGDTEEPPPPPPPPPDEEPMEPTFTNVHTILRASCGGSQCHLNQRESGVMLDTYENVTGSVGEQYGTEIVNPGDADDSPIVDKIEANPTYGERMPLEGGVLSDDEIQLIKDWINAGALDN